jgi:hypothetical protein
MAETRRSILKAAGALSALATLPLPAQTPTPAATPTPVPEKKPEALARIARERYGKFLSEAEQALMDEDMAFVETRSARLQKLRLANGEEPAVDFRASRP